MAQEVKGVGGGIGGGISGGVNGGNGGEISLENWEANFNFIGPVIAIIENLNDGNNNENNNFIVSKLVKYFFSTSCLFK